jgi:hypothetical protein
MDVRHDQSSWEIVEGSHGGPLTVRFRNVRGATISVSLDHITAPLSPAEALIRARQAVMQLASLQASDQVRTSVAEGGKDTNGALFWSWARPAP